MTTTGSFSDAEKTRVLHFLGYPDWEKVVKSIALGYPAASQPLFLVYQAFTNLTHGGESNVRRDLCELEAIERQLGDARGRFKASVVGSITLNPNEARMLRNELEHWTKRLEDDLGIVRNPYSQMSWRGQAGGVSGKVEG